MRVALALALTALAVATVPDADEFEVAHARGDLRAHPDLNPTHPRPEQDVCSFNNGGCDYRATCKPSPSSKQRAICSCNNGYMGDGFMCTDLCKINNGGCDLNARCARKSEKDPLHESGAIKSEISCYCNKGYEGTGEKCTTASACLVDNGGCHNDAVCSTKRNQAVCTCKPGFSGNGMNCYSIDACAASNGGCSVHATCIQTGPGTRTCACDTNYTGNGVSCTELSNCDVTGEEDESLNYGGCSEYAACVHVGPKRNDCFCNSGFSGNGKSCTEINVCTFFPNGGCHKFAECQRRGAADFGCTCKVGYTGSGKVCKPINNCATNVTGCSKNANCSMTGPGTNACICNGGFTGDGKTCNEINECAYPELNACHKDATCTKTGKNEHVCQCKRGFTGDGENCTVVDVCILKQPCDPNAICIMKNASAVGDNSFLCSCNLGYTGNGKTCQASCDKKQSDCKHGSVLDVETCRCTRCPKPFAGPFCEQCTRTQDSCRNEGRLDNVSCTCKDCKAPFRGATCAQCGRSEFDCKHGGTLDRKNCSCECKFPYEGALCTECGLPDSACLNNGKINKKTCKCYNCADNWGGDRCETCVLQDSDCGANGQVDKASCVCHHCAYPWTGPYCNKCPRTNAMCAHNGVIDSVSCTCTNCSAGWAGEKCEICMREDEDCSHGFLDKDTCKCVNAPRGWAGEGLEKCVKSSKYCHNGGVIDPVSCRCKCKGPWSGLNCTECKLDACQSGTSLNKETCSCNCRPEHIEKGYGDTCGPCTLTDAQCRNEGVVNKSSCRCEKCVGPFTGRLCQECTLNADSCLRGGKFVPALCRCVACPKGWTGSACEKCARNSTFCKNGGKFNPETCTCEDCDAPWKGQSCETCNLECDHGAELDKKTCTCSCPKETGQKNAQWKGRRCSECNVVEDECKHNGVFAPGACACRGCDLPWKGARCNVCDKKALNCLHAGKPHYENCTCECQKGWMGQFCELKECPKDKKEHVCSTLPKRGGPPEDFHGECVRSKDGLRSACHCSQRWGGPACNETKEFGSCTFNTAGHVQNFDGGLFEWYHTGEFIAYKAMQDPMQEEVHVLQTRVGPLVPTAGVSGVAISRRASLDADAGTVSILGNAVKPCLDASSKCTAASCNDAAAAAKCKRTCSICDTPEQPSFYGLNRILYSCNTQDPDTGTDYSRKVLNAGLKGFTFPNEVTLMFTGEYIVASMPSGTQVVLSRWMSPVGPRYSEYFNMFITINQAQTGVNEGICGNFDGVSNSMDAPLSPRPFNNPGGPPEYLGEPGPFDTHNRVRKINSYFQCKGVFDVDAHTKELMSRPDNPADLLKEQPKDADVDPTDVGACRIKSKKEPITADSPIVFKKKAKAACALFCNQTATQNPNACRFCLMDVCYHQDLSLAGNAAAYLFADASTAVMSKALATFSLAVESEDRVLMKPDPESTKEDSETGEEDATSDVTTNGGEPQAADEISDTVDGPVERNDPERLEKEALAQQKARQTEESAANVLRAEVAPAAYRRSSVAEAKKTGVEFHLV